MKFRWNESTGFFGGTFDPPHLGHLAALTGVLQKPGLKKVLVSPAPRPPQKALPVDYETRVSWVRKLLEFAPPEFRDRLVLDQTENALSATGPNYTYDVLQKLAPEHPHLVFVMGTDQFLNLNSWHRFPEVLDVSHWIVLMRRGFAHDDVQTQRALFEGSGLLRSGRAADELAPRAEGEIARYSTPKNRLFLLCETDAPEISSTELRRELQIYARWEDLSAAARNSLPKPLDILYRQYILRSRTA